MCGCDCSAICTVESVPAVHLIAPQPCGTCHEALPEDTGDVPHLASGENAAGRAQQVWRVGGCAEVVAAADAAEQRDEVTDARHSEREPLQGDMTLFCMMSRLHVRLDKRAAIQRR